MRLLHSRSRGFTLIELMVVTVIIALIAAVVIPTALSAMQAARANKSGSATIGETISPSPRISQAAPQATVGAEGAPGRPLPLRSTDLSIEINPYPVLVGVQVATHFDASLVGTFGVRNDDRALDHVRLDFPFPPGISEAREVRLSRLGPTGFVPETAGATYGIDGIHWQGRLAPGESATLQMAYTVRGREAFVYNLATAGRTESMHVQLLVPHAGGVVIPPEALQPSSRDDDTVHWDYDRLVATQPLIVELPAGASPLGQLVLLCQLAALAVLLFGAGYWYLGELRQPGSLDDFRWGHFLLLALNYTLFFAIFSVLSYQGHRGWALLAALALSQPLLLLHSARLSTRRFALTQVLPLSLITLGAVVAGVYLVGARPYVFLAVAVVVLAVTTLTYRRWAAGQAAHQKERRARADREVRAWSVRRAEGELQKVAEEAAALELKARRWLAEPAEGIATAQSTLRRARGGIEEALSQARIGCGEPPQEGRAHQTWVRESLAHTSHRSWLLAQAIAQTTEAIAGIELRSRQRRELPALEAQVDDRCLACGAPPMGEAHFCARCGVARPTRLACAACDAVVDLPGHLLVPRWIQSELHCRRCGSSLPRPVPAAALAPSANAGPG